MLSIVKSPTPFLYRCLCICMCLLLLSRFDSFAQDNNALESRSNAKEDYLNATIESRSFNSDSWQKAIEGIDYSGDAPDEVDIDEDEDDGTIGEGGEIRERQYDRSSSSEKTFWGNFFKILFIILVIIVIAVLAYFLIGGSISRPKSRKFEAGDGSINIENVEENIHESDLEGFIRQALAEGNFALAVRLYYLAVIKELSLNKKIKWKKDKTNRDYQNELRSGPLFQPFKRATRIFERVWYGNGQLDQQSFEQLQPIFRGLIDRVQKG